MQVQAIIHILLHFNWTYVSVVYTEGGYGQKAVERLLTLTAENGICVGTSVPVIVGQRQHSFDNIIGSLYKGGVPTGGTGAKVTIYFLGLQPESEPCYHWQHPIIKGSV